MKNHSFPEKLYRYRPLPAPNNPKDGLEDLDLSDLEYRIREVEEAQCQKLFFRSLTEQNDVFDEHPNLITSPSADLLALRDRLTEGMNLDRVARAVRSCSATALREHISENLKNHRERQKIACLSATETDPIMWGHYANSGTGVCFEYEINNPDPSRGDRVAREMEYETKRPCLSEIEAFIMTHLARCKDNGTESDKEVAYQAIKKLVGYKAKGWSYEQEFRISVNSKKEPNGPYYKVKGLHQTGVIFGHKVHPEVREKLCTAFPKGMSVKNAVPSMTDYKFEIQDTEV